MISAKSTPINRLLLPISDFIKQEKSGGLVLGISVVIALFLANSPWQEEYFGFFDKHFGFKFNGNTYLDLSIHHWINDGLMAIFFFVVGLELKREIIAGELSSFKKAVLPLFAAIGGMLMPALLYLALNPTGEVQNGWGIPMATDIAFALGVLYLLGNRIPLSLKVFLTALAIVDDLGAVLVIAFFYSSKIHFTYLLIGVGFLLIMFFGKRLGIRNTLFYALFGIGGVWTFFLLSGVHATIAAVLAAFMMPINVKIDEPVFIARLKKHITRFSNADPNGLPTLTNEQLHILERISVDTKKAMPPLQRLEHAMHPFVTFVVIPIFAIANAGVSFLDIKMDELFSTNVALGIGLGLLLGKLLGIVGFSWLGVKLKLATLPPEINFKSIFGVAFLAGIGFTMSLFITQLAFVSEVYQTQAKIGIFVASLIGGIVGYNLLKSQKPIQEKTEE